jgi:tetratricopeptide (TPR) repeat protein
MSAEAFLSKGVAAARAGDRAAARQWLAQAVQADPKLAEGWWWLAQVLEDEAQRRYCLQRVQVLDPSHPIGGTGPGKPSQPATLAARPPTPRHGLETERPASTPSARSESEWPPSTPSSRLESEWPPSTPSVRSASERPASTLPTSAAPKRRRPALRPVSLTAAAALGGVLLIGITIVIVALAMLPRGRSAASGALATLPPVWTDTPAPTPVPSPTALPTQPPPTPDPLSGNELAAQALALMVEEKYEEAIPLWDEVLLQDPANHAAYYQRALSNLEASTGETILQIFQVRVLEAMADADQAIALSDGLNGDYFRARGWAYEKLASITELRVDRDRLLEIALENFRRAAALPSGFPYLRRSVALEMINLGRCEEAEEEARRFLEERGGDTAAPSIGLEAMLGSLNLCLGNFDEAIYRYGRSIERYPDCGYIFSRSAAYYHKGDINGATNDLSKILRECPSYAGYRYYLEALIYQERGDTERALKDLQTGAMNTWGRGGLYLYVQSLIALERGDRAKAVELLKQAEMTMEYTIGPFIERFQRELAALGEEPYLPTPEPYPAVTPMAALPDGHPTPPPVRTILLTDGSGPLELMPGSVLDLYFVAPAGFSFYDITSLELHLLSDQGGVPPLEAKMYLSRKNRWQLLEVEWGENQLDDPDALVNATGDVYLRLRALGPEPLVLRDVGLEMAVQEQDGGYARYSFRDE